jgi:hypothetical protein
METTNIAIGYIRNNADTEWILAIVHAWDGTNLYVHTDEGEKCVSVNSIVFSLH